VLDHTTPGRRGTPHSVDFARRYRTVQPNDVAKLAPPVRASATVLDLGVALWPYEQVDAAIDELARLGRVILGVDARDRDDSGFVTEVPISDFQRAGDLADIEASRRQAHDVVTRVEEITGWRQPSILLTW
jgi:hypothetical protein